MASLAWLLGIFYYTKTRHLKEPVLEQWNAKVVLYFVLILVVSVLVFYGFSTLAPKRPPDDAAKAATGLVLVQWVVIWVLAAFLFRAIMNELKSLLKRRAAFFGAAFILGFLLGMKILYNQVFFANLMLIGLMCVLTMEFAVRLKRSGFITFFALIAVVDICLVWLTSNVGNVGSISGHSGTATTGNWYMRMFQSEFMQHFPFPLGLRWEGRMLGNGDVFFLCLTAMYAKRVWSTRAAIIAGLLATLPIILIPLAIYIFKTPPIAWPYTIFIAPVALFIGIFHPQIIELPDYWKNEDGSDSLGRYPKSH